MNSEREFINELKPMINNISNDGLCFLIELVGKVLRERLTIERAMKEVGK